MCVHDENGRARHRPRPDRAADRLPRSARPARHRAGRRPRRRRSMPADRSSRSAASSSTRPTGAARRGSRSATAGRSPPRSTSFGPSPRGRGRAAGSRPWAMPAGAPASSRRRCAATAGSRPRAATSFCTTATSKSRWCAAFQSAGIDTTAADGGFRNGVMPPMLRRSVAGVAFRGQWRSPRRRRAIVRRRQRTFLRRRRRGRRIAEHDETARVQAADRRRTPGSPAAPRPQGRKRSSSCHRSCWPSSGRCSGLADPCVQGRHGSGNASTHRPSAGLISSICRRRSDRSARPTVSDAGWANAFSTRTPRSRSANHLQRNDATMSCRCPMPRDCSCAVREIGESTIPSTRRGLVASLRRCVEN